MVFKLCLSAEKRGRRLNRPTKLAAVMDSIEFHDGVPVEEKKAA
jgi:hypothetical protein